MKELRPDEKCAPAKKYTDGSCFTTDSLKKIADSYNKKYQNKIRITENKKELVEQLEDRMKDKCSNQVCWLRQEFVRGIVDETMKNTFRPDGPNDSKEWLSTRDIDKVMEQYQEKYSDFCYLGTVPYDFEELPILEFDKMDFNEMERKGKNRLGMVINLDEHDQSGSHWVALYADLKKNQVYFFDSFGKAPGGRIRKFATRIAKHLYQKKFGEQVAKEFKYIVKGLNKQDKLGGAIREKLNQVDVRFNKIQHQFENTECGVYSINFIIRLLKGETFNEITNNITKDAEMNQCRNVYFR
jgi:hypothetical protein